MLNKNFKQRVEQYLKPRESDDIYEIEKHGALINGNYLIIDTDLPITRESCEKYKDQIEVIILTGKVKEIGKGAFEGYPNLNPVIYGPNLEKIGSFAFSGCKNLTQFMPMTSDKVQCSITSYYIEDPNYQNCMEINDKLKFIGQESFSDTAVQKVLIKNNNVKVRSGAFEGCSQLKKLVIKDVNNINLGVSCFAGCPELMVNCDTKAFKRIAKYVFADTKYGQLVSSNQKPISQQNGEINITKTKISNLEKVLKKPGDSHLSFQDTPVK